MSTKYVAIDADSLVWGIGDSEEAAMADARTWWGDSDSDPADELMIWPASERLTERIHRDGGIYCHFRDQNGVEVAIDPDEDAD